ncbi:MAG: PAS domain-containing sensor histidine kinase [Desulfovibrio sp.]|nr:MAG: PAS domain-containing sensor histidine kinase [Desulfovibrio sp.]
MDNLHKALLNATSDNALVIDTEGVVLAANQAMYSRLGISPALLLGHNVLDLFPPDVAARRKIVLQSVVRSGEVFRFEDLTQSGAMFEATVYPVLNEVGEAEKLVVCIRDVTAPKRAEVERHRLGSAIEQTVEAIIIMDNDLCVNYVNQAFEEMTGYAQQDMKGEHIGMLYWGEEQKRALHRVAASLEESDSWQGRTVNTRKDGSSFTCEQTVARIRGKRFLPLGYVSIWRDVTETEQLERQLRQAQKMEAIGTLSGGIAHDFNNILGPIILHAELRLAAIRESGVPDPCQTSFEEILGAANRAKSLVEQILGLSRRQEHDKPVPFQLSLIIKECLKLLGPSLPSSLDITFDNRADNDLILADPTMVHQVIMNLCTNAAHAMEEQGGKLSIAVGQENLDEPRPGPLSTLRPGAFVRLSVTDTGCGISQKDLERIFDPFFTTKQDSVGTGLGLAVVQTIVTGLGGGMRVTSEPGQGSCFEVLLPQCDPGLLGAAANGPLEHAEQRQEKILFVDSDAMLAQGGMEALKQLGFTVTRCANGFEALALFRQDPEQFDLVLVEAALPELSGMGLARELLLSRPELPVVLCSGYTSSVLRDKTEAFNAAQGDIPSIRGFLTKPFHLEELAATLNQALATPS